MVTLTAGQEIYLEYIDTRGGQMLKIKFLFNTNTQVLFVLISVDFFCAITASFINKNDKVEQEAVVLVALI